MGNTKDELEITDQTKTCGCTKTFDDEMNEIKRKYNDALAPDKCIRTISVYIDDGRVFKYNVSAASDYAAAAKAREHCHAIATNGYRHNDGNEFEEYPVWRVLKVKTSNIPTNYLDSQFGT